ncbi:MAG TPA: AI-2E family transporter [Beijerinckiaceae bacterium]|jgi:predicted PurR-regulated permease PerM
MADAPTPRPAPANEVPPAETPTPASLMTLAVGVAVAAALYVAQDVLLPIVLAVLLAFVLAPFVDLLRRWRLGRVLSVAIAVLFALGVIAALAATIGLQVAQLGTDLPRYETTIRAKVEGLKGGVIGRASDYVRHLGREIERATEDKSPAKAIPSPETGPQPAPEVKPLPVEVRQPDLTPVELARRFLLPVVHPLATVFITLVVVIFILLQREDLRDRMIRLFGARDLHRTTIAMDDAARRLSRYYLTQLALNGAFGVVTALALWAIGVPSPLLWGIFAAIMRFVPYVGSFVAAVLPVALAAAVDPGWSMALMTVAFFIVAEPMMGHVVEPLVYGQSTGLSPFAVVLSAIFWTWLWGPVGLVIAMPLTLCLVVLGRHVERLEFLDVLLGDRPALTPSENFYQRLLAGDPDEALEHAEQLLKERSISSYYDEVALRGLQLAANDATRGVLTPPQIERIKDAIKGLVNDLASFPDEEPKGASEPKKEDVAGATLSEKALPKDPPVESGAPNTAELPERWRGEAPVMCIAGRGPLDEAAATMLAQLLRKHGLGARVVPHEAVSRSNIIGLDTKGVALACISYLDISGNPAHLRYLIRRLRQKLKDAPILVGLWPAEDPVLVDESLRKAIGADYYVASLREALKACLEAAREAARRETEMREPDETARVAAE